MGVANQIVAVGTFIIPIQGPMLHIGRWRLFGEGDCQELMKGLCLTPATRSMSEPFTVTPCAPACDTTLADAALQAWKDVAEGPVGDFTKLSCYLMTVASVIDPRTGAKVYHKSRRAGDYVEDAIEDRTGDLIGDIAEEGIGLIGFGMFAYATLELNVPMGYNDAMMSMTSDILCNQLQMFKDIAEDPPDPAYLAVAPPEFVHYPTTGIAGGDALVDGAEDARAYGTAQRIAVERYKGAVLADDLVSARLQADAISDYGLLFVDALRRQRNALWLYGAELAETPGGEVPELTEADRDSLVSTYERIRADGLAPSEVADLQGLGLTPEMITDVEAFYDLPIEDVPVGVTVSEQVTALADRIDAAIPDLEMLGNEASVIAATLDTNVSPVASFTTNPLSGNAPLTVTFTSTSTDAENDALTVTWDFGDGEVGSGSPVTHVYPDTGTFFPTMTVSDGHASENAFGVVVVTPPGANQGPIASFTVEPSSGIEPLTVKFTDTSTDPDDDPLTASWDFGDGSTGTGSPIFHDYPSSGNYFAVLTVSDGELTGQTLVVVTVQANNPPVASFTQSRTEVSVPDDVIFTNTSTDADGQALTYLWVFGDGATSTEESPTHTYTGTGQFNVRLTVTDTSSATAEAFGVVTGSQNRPPEPTNDIVITNQDVALDILGNDFEPDQDPVTLISYTQPSHGSVDCGDLGGCLYRTDPGFVGTDSFEYTVADPDGLEGSATVEIGVQGHATTDVLNLRSDAIATVSGQAVEIDVLANDNPSTLVVDEVSDANHGTVTCDPDGPCTYTPDAEFVGYDGFRYTASNGSVQAAADVLVLVAPAASGLTPTVAGSPLTPTQGDDIHWLVGTKPTPAGLEQSAALLFASTVEVDISGAQALPAGAITTAPGWTATSDATGIHLVPTSSALLGESVSSALPRPAQPISQGTGGDGHVPIVVGNRVYAFFHHQWPTQVTCIDRTTGQLCPSYPRQLNIGAGNIIGRAAVVGSRIYVHADVSTGHSGVALYCWDTDIDETCGMAIVDRVDGFGYAAATPPVNVGGLLYFTAQTGLLYCVNPATNEACAAAPLDTKIGDGFPTPSMDIVAHGNRVFSYDQNIGEASCIDVSTRAVCPGWTAPRDVGFGLNLVNRHAADGQTTGVCFVDSSESKCINDSTPGTVDAFGPWPESSTYYNIASEAEAGTRTFYGSGLGTGGVGCWDWVTMEPCVGPNFNSSGEPGSDGFASRDIDGNFLPNAYGTAWDGNCAIGLGDAGLMFTSAFDGSSPCTTLSTSSSQRAFVDLRSQRCDNSVGGATWLDVRALEVDLNGADAEFTTFLVTVRDAITGATLATKELVGTNGVLDLSAINAAAHPKLSVDVSATSVPGAPAWSDNNPPRVELHWVSDPAALCLRTTTAVDCAALDPADATAIAVLGTKQAQATVKVGLSPTCAGGENHAPVGTPDSYTTPRDTALVVPALTGVLSNDTDADGDTLTAAKVADPTHGSVTLNANGSFTYTPAANYVGPDSSPTTSAMAPRPQSGRSRSRSP